jgi:hypothetical protein
MTSEGRSAGSVVCLVFAALSMIGALIVSGTALSASSQVSDEPPRPNSLQPALFADPTCGSSKDAAPDQLFLACLSEYEARAQEDAAFWAAEAAARQAGTQAKGHLAIILGLLALTFAVCATVLNAGRGSVPHTAAPPASAPDPAAGQGTTPTQ